MAGECNQETVDRLVDAVQSVSTRNVHAGHPRAERVVSAAVLTHPKFLVAVSGLTRDGRLSMCYQYQIVHAQDKLGQSVDEPHPRSQSGTAFGPRGARDWEVPLDIQSTPCGRAPPGWRVTQSPAS